MLQVKIFFLIQNSIKKKDYQNMETISMEWACAPA